MTAVAVKELAQMKMEELIAEYNTWATANSKPTIESFKSLRAARAAVQTIRTPNEPAAVAEAAGANGDDKVKDQKYTSTDKRGPTQGVGKRAKELLLEGKTVKETLELVKGEFPTSNTNMNCINFYRAALVREGKIPRTRIEVANNSAEAIGKRLEAAKQLVADLEARLAKAQEAEAAKAQEAEAAKAQEAEAAKSAEAKAVAA